MSEYLLRMKGGPHPGDRVANNTVLPWPPPEVFPDEGGEYVKTSQSAITDEQAAEMTFVLRGAAYEWREAVPE